jgi:hypothetical protein
MYSHQPRFFLSHPARSEMLDFSPLLDLLKETEALKPDLLVLVRSSCAWLSAER